jgi:hypothetical protein
MLHTGGASIPRLHNLALALLYINEILSSNTASIPHLHNLALALLKYWTIVVGDYCTVVVGLN